MGLKVQVGGEELERAVEEVIPIAKGKNFNFRIGRVCGSHFEFRSEDHNFSPENGHRKKDSCFNLYPSRF